MPSYGLEAGPKLIEHTDEKLQTVRHTHSLTHSLTYTYTHTHTERERERETHTHTHTHIHTYTTHARDISILSRLCRE